MIFASVLGAASTSADAGSAGRDWTLEDIISAPDIDDVKLSKDRSYALYIVLAGDAARNEMRSELRKIKLSDKAESVWLNAATIKQLRQIPGTDDWSVLADLGEGVQLYRVDNGGRARQIVSNPDTVLVGTADQAVMSWVADAPGRVGILSHDWSPDGKWLWYSILRASDQKPTVQYDAQVLAKRVQLRSQATALIDFRLRGPDGQDRIVATRPTTDSIALYYGGQVAWHGSTLSFRVMELDADGQESFGSYEFDLKNYRSRKSKKGSDNRGLLMPKGVRGGNLASEGTGEQRMLTETLENGKQHVYGSASYTLMDGRSAGAWISDKKDLAIAGTRGLQQHNFSLALFDKFQVKKLNHEASLTLCDFDSDLTFGVCVREAQNLAPELVSVQPRSGVIQTITSLSSRHDGLKKLKVSGRTWTNRLGYKATGFVVLPFDYDHSKAYPAVFVTHGSDADDRFVLQDLQWEYPVQLFAQAGYVVVLINDPAERQEPRISEAYDQWLRGEGKLTATEMQMLLFINGVFSFEDAAIEMAKEGLIDIKRMGIAGYSRGSQMVNVTMTQSKLFKAASSGDGAYLEPFSYPLAKRTYNNFFGGSPLGPALPNYHALSPSLRATKACGAVLFQMAAPYAQSLDFYESLQEAGVPTQISLYPGETPVSDETHLFHIPKNRLAAMQENLAWFDYWLLDRTDRHAAPDARIKVWKKMKTEYPKRCEATGSPVP